MKAVILAAGFGERIREVRGDLPKPLLNLGTQAILEHLLTIELEAGFSEIYILIGHRGDEIQKYIEHSSIYSKSIKFVVAQEFERGPLSTFLNIESYVQSGDFLVTPGDLYLSKEILQELLLHHVTGEFSLAVDELMDSKTTTEVFIKLMAQESDIEIGQVLGLNEPVISSQTLVKRHSIPLLIVNAKIFPYAKRAKNKGGSRLVDALNLALKDDLLIRSIKISGHFWQDIDIPLDLKRVLNHIKKLK